MKKYFTACVILASAAIVACVALLAGCDGLNPETPSYTLSYAAEAGGYIDGEARQTVKAGEDGETVTAVANDGYTFVTWSDGNTEPVRRDTAVSSDVRVTASFEKSAAETKYCTLTYTSSVGGCIEGETEQTVPSRGSGKLVRAVAHDGYKFVKWSDGKTNAYRTDVHVTADIRVEAQFAELEYYTVGYRAQPGGHIEGETEQRVLEKTRSVPVTAVAEHGYAFSHWSDGAVTPTRSDVGTRDITYTAVFAEAAYYTLRYFADEDKKGYILGEATQRVYKNDDGTTVTAVANHGYEFYGWSDGVETASRTDTNVTAGMNVTALFRTSLFDYEYVAEKYGRIDGEAHQTVKRNEYGTTVTAVPDDGYVFNGWSDGVTDIARRDRGGRYGADGRYGIGDNPPRIIIYAKFTQYLTVAYKTENDAGGHITGQTEQTLHSNHGATEVTAVPDDGYVFVGWSDGVTDATRRDGYLVRDFTATAYFEPIVKTFTYDYCGGGNGVSSRTVSVARDDPKSATFVVPQKSGYAFGGWYADERLTLRVTDDEGELMLGYNTVSLATDTLYARWIDPADKTVRYKVLVVIVDEIDAMLRSRITGEYKRYFHKISLRERKIYAQTAERMASYLNEWFDGKVIFEVDTYFTTIPIGTESFVLDKTHIPPDNELFADKIDEVKGVDDKYDSILTVFNLNDLIYKFHCAYGYAKKKYGSIRSETFMRYADMYSLENLLDKTKGDITKGYDTQVWKMCNEVCLHELTHTIECQYSNDNIYHVVIFSDKYRYTDSLEVTRLFLLCEIILNDQSIGIPPEFWGNRDK